MPGTRAASRTRPIGAGAEDRARVAPALDIRRVRQRVRRDQRLEVERPAPRRARDHPVARARRVGGGAELTSPARASRSPSIRAATRQPGPRAVPCQPTWIASASVPVVASASRPASITTSARYPGPVAYRNTDRVIPPCHHWSWSSTNERVGPLDDRQPQRAFAPGRTRAPSGRTPPRGASPWRPRSRSRRARRSARSPPRRRGARPDGPTMPSGTVNTRSYTPVGFSAGTSGGRSGNGIRTFV